MNEISKEDKINYLKGIIDTVVGMVADDLLPYIDYDDEKEYVTARAILMDYSPEEAAKYSENFQEQVNKYVDEINKLVEEGKL